MPAHQEGALRHQVDPEIVELDDVRLVEQQGAADPRAAVLARCLQADQVRKLGGVRAALLTGFTRSALNRLRNAVSNAAVRTEQS